MRRSSVIGLAVVFPVVCVLVLAAVWSARSEDALVPGGLTALPALGAFGEALVQNGDFEIVSSGRPTGWSGDAAWAADNQIRRSGEWSYRVAEAASVPYTQVAVQRLTLRRGIYRLSGWIKTENLGTNTTNAGVRLNLDYSVDGVLQRALTPVVGGTRDWTYFERANIVVPEDRTAQLKLETYREPSGTAWFDDVRVEEQTPLPLDVFLLYPNFRGILFDDQSQTLRFDVTVQPATGALADYLVAVSLEEEASGAVVAHGEVDAAAHLVATLDGSVMQLGQPYLARLALVNRATGERVFEPAPYRVSRAPGSARATMNVSVDERNRILIRGVPRFVLGVYDSGIGYGTTDGFWETTLWSPSGPRRLEGLRINFYLNYFWGQAPASAMQSLMTNLQKRGVMYLQTGNCFTSTPASAGNFLIDTSDAYVQDVGAHPGSAGYYVADECDSAVVPETFAQYQRLKRLDPDSLTFAALLGNPPDAHFWRDAVDVLATDPYPLYGAEPAAGYRHRDVADWTILAREAVKDARPFMTVLQFFRFTSLGRWPTLAEMRNHAYMAIVEGARGLWWWSLGDNALEWVCPDWCDDKTRYMDQLRSVVGELADLEPVLLADDAPGALAGNSHPSAIRTKVKVVDGRGYVFAYNITNATVTATLTWNGPVGTVGVNAEGRTLVVGDDSFTDTFEPYQAHVYLIGEPEPAGGGDAPPPPPPTLALEFTNPAAGAAVSETVTVSFAATGATDPTYRVTLDGAPLYAGTNGSFSWNTLAAVNGDHTLAATVTDPVAGSATASIPVTVANAAPPLTLAFSAPASDATVSGTTTVTLAAAGGNGGYSYTVTVAGTPVYSGTSASFAWNTTTVANGAQTLGSTVTDGAGTTATASVTVTVANTAPAGTLTVGFTSPAAGAIVAGTQAVRIWVTGATGLRTFTLSVNGVVVATQSLRGSVVTLSWDTTQTPDGPQMLTASVQDGRGRTGTASRGVTVRNAPAP